MEALDDLIRVLDREAVVIEHVLFRLKALELLLAADEHRFLALAAEELEDAAERAGTLEAMRALAAEESAEGLGVDPGEINLSEILRVADERQRGDLVRAQLRLRGLLAELEEQANLDRDLALARIAKVRATIERLSGTPGSRYGQDGITRRSRAGGAVDERL